MTTAKNERGAGRKALPYKTKPMRIPSHLESKIRDFIKEELKNEKSHNDNSHIQDTDNGND